MQKSRSTATLGTVGVIVVAFSLVAFFLLPFDKTALHYWALGFLVTAELAFFGGLILTRSLRNHSRLFLNAGVASALSKYLTLTVIAVAASPLFYTQLNLFIILNFALISLCAIYVVTTVSFAGRSNEMNEKLASDRKFMDSCQQRVYNLSVNPKNAAYENELTAICEALKYSDKMGTTSLDDKINHHIVELEEYLPGKETDGDYLTNTLEELSTYITMRKAEMAQLKRGKF